MVVKKVLIISGRTDVSVRNIKQQIVDNHGHSFTKKTFNCPRPIYCHHCLDLLNWKLINNGLNCEGEINLTSCDYLLQVTSWQEPKPKETVFQFLIRRALFIAHIILISTEFKDWDLQFIQIDWRMTPYLEENEGEPDIEKRFSEHEVVKSLIYFQLLEDW